MATRDQKILKLYTIEAMALELVRVSREARELIQGEDSPSPTNQSLSDEEIARGIAKRRKKLFKGKNLVHGKA